MNNLMAPSVRSAIPTVRSSLANPKYLIEAEVIMPHLIEGVSPEELHRILGRFDPHQVERFFVVLASNIEKIDPGLVMNQEELILKLKERESINRMLNEILAFHDTA